MKPNFALNLSHEGISLLHRAKAGWLRVGEVALDDPDLNAQLGVLRKTAAGLDSGGLASKLIIPNSQILYTEVEAPGPDNATRQAQIRDGLAGLTPYDVNDLVFDYRLNDGKAQVAVVARETLAEAETFAVEYRFNPVTFVGVPVNGEFDGEPYFGLTKHAPTLLGDGESVERDGEPMEVMGAVPPEALKLLDPVEVPEPIVDRGEPKPATDPMPQAELAEDMPPVAFKSRNAPPAPDTSDGDTPEAAPDKSDVPPLPQVTFASRRIVNTPPADAPPAKPITASTVAENTAPPPAPGRLTASSLDVDDVPAMPSWRSAGSAGVTPMAVTAGHTADSPAPAVPGTPARNGVTAAFAKRDALGSESAVPPRVSPALTSQKEAESLTLFGERGNAIQGSKPRYFGLLVTLLVLLALAIVVLWAVLFLRSDGEETTVIPTEIAPSAPAVEESATEEVASAPTGLTTEAPSAPTAAEPGSDVTGVETPGSGSDGIGGAIDTALLTPPQGEAALPGTDPAAPLAQPAPGTEPEQDTEELARLQTGTSDLVDEPSPDQITEAPPSAEEAQARYVATGIWQRDPEQLSEPAGGDRLEELYVASIDPQVISQDAILIPRVSPDQRPASLAAPTPLGRRFELDERGLVTATPGGAPTPEGHIVFLGRPPIVPGVRPGTALPTPVALEPGVEAPETPEVEVTEPETQPLTAEQLRLREIRPQPRPDTLQETNERSRLGGFTRTELATIRPVPRPQSAQEEIAAAAAASTSGVIESESPAAEASSGDSGTRLAVAISDLPSSRPRNFDRTVARARARNASNTETASTAGNGNVQVAAARVPRIPTRASVAREATERNAINLGRVNLIGVYGTPSDRRALVRLKSGRYVKVEVGDRVDGGRVAAIGDDELRYVKGGRNITLRLPKG